MSLFGFTGSTVESRGFLIRLPFGSLVEITIGPRNLTPRMIGIKLMWIEVGPRVGCVEVGSVLVGHGMGIGEWSGIG